MTENDIKRHEEAIDKLSHAQMARLWRYGPAGHLYFVSGPLHEYFMKRFDSFGGMTPGISKAIGWDG